MRHHASVIVRVFLSFVLAAGLAGEVQAQNVTIALATAATRIASEINDMATDLRIETMRGPRADAIRQKVKELDDQFVKIHQQLDAEKAALKGDPDRNAEQLKRLDQVAAMEKTAHDRLITLQRNMASDQAMANAVTSGFLKKTTAAVASEAKAASQALEQNQRQLAGGGQSGSGGDAQSGIGDVEINGLQIRSGKMKLFLATVDGDQELGQGRTKFRIRLPVRLRASIEDANKVRLTQQLAGGNAGNTIEWEPADPYRHKFAYTGRPGKTAWSAKEKYVFTVDQNDPGARFVRYLKQSNVDGATAMATGDVAEIFFTGPVAQKVTVRISAASLGWERNSTLNGKAIRQTVKPEDAEAEAELVLSYFSLN